MNEKKYALVHESPDSTITINQQAGETTGDLQENKANSFLSEWRAPAANSIRLTLRTTWLGKLFFFFLSCSLSYLSLSLSLSLSLFNIFIGV